MSTALGHGAPHGRPSAARAGEQRNEASETSEVRGGASALRVGGSVGPGKSAWGCGPGKQAGQSQGTATCGRHWAGRRTADGLGCMRGLTAEGLGLRERAGKLR